MQGWIKLHRSIMESDTFRTLTIKQKIIAIYIILNANHKDGIWTDQYKGIQTVVKRGQIITSPQKIADFWFPKDKEITRQVVRTTLDKLCKLNFLTKHTTNDYTLINVVNYGVYQDSEEQENQDINQALTKPQPSLNQALTTNKNVEECKEGIYTIFDHWNTKGIIKHKKMNQKMKSHINARLEEYKLDDLKKAIDNYKSILDEEKYYWSHKWTLQDFMKPNNVVRFTDDADPFTAFSKNKNQNVVKYPSKTQKNQQVIDDFFDNLEVK